MKLTLSFLVSYFFLTFFVSQNAFGCQKYNDTISSSSSSFLSDFEYVSAAVFGVTRGILNGGPSCRLMQGPLNSTPHAVPRFLSGNGIHLQDSAVSIDDAGNVALTGITRAGVTVNWPTSPGAENTFLKNDGAGNLVYDVPFLGDENVISETHLTTDNALPVIDLVSGVNHLKESVVIVDELGNMTGVNELTVAGDITIEGQESLIFQDGAGSGKYVGMRAPESVNTNYTVSLPAEAPLAGQFLQASQSVPFNLQWTTAASLAPPSVTRAVYVSTAGSDTLGNGSFATSYATVAKAINVANSLSTLARPVTIYISPGTYVEDNSAGPLTITAGGISLVGGAVGGVILSPTTLSNNFILTTTNVSIGNIIFDAKGLSTATGVSVAGLNSSTLFSSVQFNNFEIGASCGGVGINVEFSACDFLNNGTGLSINNASVSCYNCDIFGTTISDTIPIGIGVFVTGNEGNVLYTGGTVDICNDGIIATKNSIVRVHATAMRINAEGIIIQSGASLFLEAASFQPLNTATTVTDIVAVGEGSFATISGCLFDAASLSPDTNSTAIMVLDAARVTVIGGGVRNYKNAFIVGDANDTSTTFLNASLVTVVGCTNDIIQGGTSTLIFNAGTATGSKIFINDPENVTFSYFDQVSSIVSIGSLRDQDITLIKPAIAASNNPEIGYRRALYSTQALGFSNPVANPSTWFVNSGDDVHITGVTSDRAKIAALHLLSDGASPVGSAAALRGWTIKKNSSTAELACTYQNSDVSDQSAISEYTVMQLDGVNNQVQLPSVETKLVFCDDTDLYRSELNTLKTDGNFVAAETVSATGGFVGNLTGTVTGASSLNILKAGDTMTGTLELPAGTVADPTLQFVGSTATGISAGSPNVLSFVTNGSERMKVSSAGVGIANLSSAGVVHNDAQGLLSSSALVNDDIADATISNAKLAAISNLNTANTLVARDDSGVFAATMITLEGATSNPTDVASKAYVDASVATSLKPIAPVKAVATLNSVFVSPNSPSGPATVDDVVLITGDGVLLTAQSEDTPRGVTNGVWIVNELGNWTRPSSGYFQTGSNAQGVYVFVTNGTTYANSSWTDTDALAALVDIDTLTFSEFSSPITVAMTNVGAGQGLIFKNQTGNTFNFRELHQGNNVIIDTDTTLANTVTISVPGVSSNTINTLVARDNSGNFAAGTITANLTGAASLNVLKTGDVLSGALTVPAGSASSPTLLFSGGTSTGISSGTVNTLSFDTNGVERMTINSSGVGINSFSTSGVVHNNASGLLSSSLLVNNDITNGTITNAKLATVSSSNSANNIVVRDSSGNFATGIMTGNVTGNVTGSASLNVLKSGDTMTGALKIPVGSISLPSLQIGSTNVGLSSTSGGLSFSTNGVEVLNISSSSGTTVNGLAGTPGVVHNNVSGLLSSSLIVNADISASAAIADSKLGTISTLGKVSNSATTATHANTVGAIVARDGSGNFSAGTITAALIGNVTGTASGNIPLAGGVATGALTLPAGSAAAPSLLFSGGLNTGISSATSNTLSFDTSGVERMTVNASGVSINNFSSVGIVHNNAAGLLSSSLIVNADVDPSAAIADSKLALISTAGKVANSATTATSANTTSAIVARDGLGNFAAGTITANVTGNVTGNLTGAVTGAASLNVLKSGDTMAGALQIPAGSAASPSLKFTGGTNTGISSPTANTLSFDISGDERMALNASALTVTGNILPSATATYNVGATASCWATIYTTDLITTNPLTGVAVIAPGATSYTTPSHITPSTRFKFTLIGGGGGGGGVSSVTTTSAAGGGGGGTGIVFLTGLSPSTTYKVTVGAGGTGGVNNTTAPTAGGATILAVGSAIYSANGGGAATNGSNGNDGVGGTTSNCTLSIVGQIGGQSSTSSSVVSGVGGSSLFGLGGPAISRIGNGNNGTGYGAGGSGARGRSGTGGAGSPGMILVKWEN